MWSDLRTGVAPDTELAGYPAAGYPAAGYPANLFCRLRGKRNRISGRIPDIKKGRISGATLIFTVIPWKRPRGRPARQACPQSSRSSRRRCCTHCRTSWEQYKYKCSWQHFINYKMLKKQHHVKTFPIKVLRIQKEVRKLMHSHFFSLFCMSVY